MLMLNVSRCRVALLAVLLVALVPAGVFGQAANAPDPSAPPQPAPSPESPEIELNLIDLPTTRSLDRHQSYFRLTHRFNRDLRRGSFGSLVEDLFSLDNGAVIGLEYRFGITDRLQAGVHRTSEAQTIQFMGKYDGWRQGDSTPISISALASIEARGNFQDDFQPAIGAAVSRAVSPALLLYASPVFVANTNLSGAGEGEDSDPEHTLLVGLGARVRLRPSAFVVGEYSPRLAGHDPGRAVWGVAIEKWTGGHTLQINFTNAFGTTYGQLARGGSDHDIYLGFNITRKF